MTLNENIQTLLAGLKTRIPPETFGKLQQMFDRLEAGRIGAGAPGSGDLAPAAWFTRGDGETVSIAELLNQNTLVLIFYRGRWCPFCDLTLRAYEALANRFREAGARLIAVSPQTVEETARTLEERRLSYEVLRDAHNAAAHAFGLDWELTPEEQGLYAAFNSHVNKANGEERWELPAPAVFVIDSGGKVQWAWVDSNWTRRAEPNVVLEVVQRLNSGGQA